MDLQFCLLPRSVRVGTCLSPNSIPRPGVTAGPIQKKKMGLAALLVNSQRPDSFYLSQDHRREDPSGATRAVGLPSRGVLKELQGSLSKTEVHIGVQAPTSAPFSIPLLQPTRPDGQTQPLPFPGSDTWPVPSLTKVQGQDHVVPKVAVHTAESQAPV